MFVEDGKLMLRSKNVSVTYAQLLTRNELTFLVGDGNYDPAAEGPKAVFSFSAVFAEVRVDPDFGLVRLNRFVGAYDCGRVINPKTARSQAIGGIIWGVGQALFEKTETDPGMGRFLNRNYSGYLVPTWRTFQNLTFYSSVSSMTKRARSASKGWVNSPRYRSRRRLRTPSITPPVGELGTCRLQSRICCEA